MNIDITDEAINQLIFKGVDNVRIDYGKFSFIVDPVSQPYLEGMRLDFVTEGLNQFFKFINPHEVSSCGCGVSVQFDI